jgi:membrane fusion protein (multidrug efflux system)
VFKTVSKPLETVLTLSGKEQPLIGSKDRGNMKKRIILTGLGLFVMVSVLGGIKGLQIGRMVAHSKQFVPPPETVTTAVVQSDDWQSVITAVGSLEAVQGVTVAAEMGGRIVNIAFEPGTRVKKGDLLVQQDTASETAQLRAAEASLSLAKSNLERKNKLLERRTISRSEFDNADAQYKQALAEADNIRAIIEKKTIRAPFAGRLGIRLVNLGQILNEGEPIVSLQSLDPIFVNFLLPQQQIAQIQTGLSVRVTTDSLPDRAVEGKITAINPQVDAATRNIRIQATLPNTEERLRPGMFANVAVVMPGRESVLFIPATAVNYAPYSDSVFVVEEGQAEVDGRASMVLRQQIVRLGEKRGDFVAVVSGLQEGQTVVSTGVFKLRNGQSVTVDNSLAPEFKLTPQPEDS